MMLRCLIDLNSGAHQVYVVHYSESMQPISQNGSRLSNVWSQSSLPRGCSILNSASTKDDLSLLPERETKAFEHGFSRLKSAGMCKTPFCLIARIFYKYMLSSQQILPVPRKAPAIFNETTRPSFFRTAFLQCVLTTLSLNVQQRSIATEHICSLSWQAQQQVSSQSKWSHDLAARACHSARGHQRRSPWFPGPRSETVGLKVETC